MARDNATYSAGIMAGGKGTRLSAPNGSKGFVEVGGRPLIEHVLGQLEVAGISKVLIAGQSQDHLLKSFVERLNRSARFDEVEFVATDDAPGTGGAVRRIAEHFRGIAHVISTIDVIAPLHMTRDLINFAAGLDDSALSVVVGTPLLHDADPLWVQVGGDHRIVTAFGKDIEPTDLVFGNVRWFSSAAGDALETLDLSAGPYRDSLIMKKLIVTYPESVRVFKCQPVFDIDDWTDVTLAEEWLQSSS